MQKAWCHNTGAAQVAGAIALASLLPSSDKDRKITYNYALNQRPHIAKEVGNLKLLKSIFLLCISFKILAFFLKI